MTGGGGQRRREMNTGGGGAGVDGGTEKPCPVSNSSIGGAGEIVDKSLDCGETKSREVPMETSSSSVDFFTQARKALCLRSPFDAEEASPQTASTSVLSTTFLPSGLANLLLKQADDGRKRRHKRSHSAGEHKAKPEKPRGSNIWTETEEYFRELTAEDMDKLYEGQCLETVGTVCKVWNKEKLGSKEYTAVDSGDNGLAVEEEEIVERVSGDNVPEFINVDISGDGNEVLKVEEVVKGDEGANLDNVAKGSNSVSINGFEWLLGTRHKIYLTSERPSKKRKLLGGDAGLEKLLVTCPVGGSSSLCHYCSTGDTGDQLNRLIVCSSCNVAVHQRCYGVENDTDGTWSCSWCKKSKDGHSSVRPCLLCPKQGGALKPAQKSDKGALEFAHLFCCQWAPELYVENTRTMEPIMNTGGISDSRRKLVCGLCKVKCGVCVRCSTGACRAAFHPLCAREARHRMEIWGRLGCDEVQMRAFCAKHSEVQIDTSGQCTKNMSDSKDKPLRKTPGDGIHKSKISKRAGDVAAIGDERNDLIVDKENINDQKLQEDGMENMSNSCTQSEIIHGQEQDRIGMAETDASKDSKSPVSLNFNTILKKLIDRGEVDVKDLAQEFGVSLDLLSPLHTDKFVFPNLNGKVETWLKDHGYLSSSHNPLKVKSLEAEAHEATPNDIKTVIDTGTDDPRAAPIKCVLPNRSAKNKGSCISNEMIHDDTVMDGNLMGLSNGDGRSSKNLKEAYECPDVELNHQTEAKSVVFGTTENTARSNDSMSEPGDGVLANDNTKVSPVSGRLSLLKEGDCSYSHQQKLIGMDNGYEYEGSRERVFSQLGASSSSGTCCNRRDQGPTTAARISEFSGADFEQLIMTRNADVLQFCPSDAVEGELIYYQHKLMTNALKRKSIMDDLISKVAKNLQQEIDTARKQKWDAVLLSQYLLELREARKQGRKERRHKEAQEILAAATAAAASSSRISSLRKDAIEESANVEENLKGKFSNGRPGFYSQQNPRVKETVSRSAAASRLTSEKLSDPFSLAPDFSVGHPRTCEICGRCETILSSILVCSSCKVAVHLDCYRGVKSSSGPWYCELCHDLSTSRGSGLSSTNSWSKPYVVAECALCGGTAGAFRKSVDGHWIHAFCAEWLLESTFRRGQVNPVSGMESLTKGNDLCTICSRKQGVCVKCSYGNCQSTFHASCARSAGFYMSVRSIGGKLQHKAYCGKHSIEQKAKAETQKHGIEEFRNLKQVRVELERLRLLCERIIKREKLKRELVICTHDILASNRDAAVLPSLSRHAFYQPDLSSDSATTSTPGYTDGRSGSDTIQRSDDVTVDSTIARKKRIKLPVSVDSDQKTDDSSVSQHFMTPKPSERMVSSGKQVPHRPAPASRNLSEDVEKRSRFVKHPETFQKELVMTSDQASVKNQRLPKGFVYVPVRCLSKEKETLPDARSQEPLEDD